MSISTATNVAALPPRSSAELLATPVQFLKGVGPDRAKLLERPGAGDRPDDRRRIRSAEGQYSIVRNRRRSDATRCSSGAKLERCAVADGCGSGVGVVAGKCQISASEC